MRTSWHAFATRKWNENETEPTLHQNTKLNYKRLLNNRKAENKNMKVLIAIPSKARIETLEENAYSWVKYLVGVDWKIFVEPQEEDEYRHVFGYENVVAIGADNLGLGYSKMCIKAYAINNHYDLVFKLDDDIRGFTDFRKKMKPEGTAHYMSLLLKQLAVCFEKNEELGAIAFPYSFEMYEKKVWEPTKRLQTAFMMRTELMHAEKHISVFEDFAAGLWILTRGKKIMKYCLTGIDMGVKVGGGSGGHQVFDRHAQALKEVVQLRNIYPPLTFRPVDKPWKIEPDLRSVNL